MAARQRLDAELVRRGLASSRTAAAHLIGERTVVVGGAVAEKASRLTSAAEAIRIVGPRPRFVSRGGEKLAAALTHFAVDVTQFRVLDAGASTGGFTDCCLQFGAAHVYAVDVGHGQIHERIRAHPRVSVVERFNVKEMALPVVGGEPVDLVVADLSFISLATVLAPLLGVLRVGGLLVALVKPQFEAGREEVSRGRGIVTDPATHAAVCARIEACLVGLGAVMMGWMESPITGAEGNVEFLVAAKWPGSDASGRTRP